ncbi:hypothetical protein CARUB_v10024398mg [Capsella rubella]|uniref:Uncharacterized protein n=1 Tax=Capsella rubella TaxID=81985 RepID=R0HVT1_9BRAS|nr:hypothetical protein CARUB_v10024398mg [Capsella rubella]EOA28208.1 hypothetical protein CARUB_v10024398mg [Capsella rubella]
MTYMEHVDFLIYILHMRDKVAVLQLLKISIRLSGYSSSYFHYKNWNIFQNHAYCLCLSFFLSCMYISLLAYFLHEGRLNSYKLLLLSLISNPNQTILF